jgi:hypothetical protein
VSKAGRLTLDTGRVAACPAGTGSCIVDVSATSATRTGSLASAAATAVTYGHVKLTVAAGHSMRIKVELSSRVRKLIRRGRLRLTVRLLLQRGTGPQRSVAFTVSLRVPAAQRSRHSSGAARSSSPPPRNERMRSSWRRNCSLTLNAGERVCIMPPSSPTISPISLVIASTFTTVPST